jgi:uncharacterized Zn finger protein
MSRVDLGQSANPRCPSCGSPQSELLPYRGGAFVAYHLYECVECDLVFRDRKSIGRQSSVTAGSATLADRD